MTNLRLQKVLYFLQGFAFQRYDLPLFPDRIEAWTYGPVVPYVYAHFASLGGETIPRYRGDEQIASCVQLDKYDSFQDKQTLPEFIDSCLELLSQYTTSQLVTKSHEAQSPWEHIWSGGAGKFQEIPLPSIRSYFLNV